MELFAATFRKREPERSELSRRAASRRRTVRVALSAFMAALSFVVMFLGVVLGVLDLSALCLASFAVVFCILEMGGAYPYLVWAVTSVLAFILLPDKLVFFEYLFFAGIYPVVKFRAARLRPLLGWIVKLVSFNAALSSCAAVSMWVLGLDADAGLSFGWLLYLAGNGMFVLYDLCLSAVSAFYLLRLRRAVGADRI